MILNAEQCYRAVLTRDARFDGRFFVAVKTTRIYCRPICRVKTPFQKNCTFFGHAAEAEVAGYRPCKRCRPELAPGSSMMEVSSQLARTTASYIGQDFLAEHSLEALAERLGVTDRQMRRVFREEFGVSPIEYWQTQRLLLAKQLLTDTRLTVASVAMASGFQSLRRFNVALKERYRMTPTELRKSHKKEQAGHSSEFSFRLGYRPPFDWKRLLEFLSRRAIPQVEIVEDGAYFRTIQLTRQNREYTGFVEVRHEINEQMLSVRLSDSLVPVCVMVLERIKRLFDLQADPAMISKVLGPLAKKRPGLRVPGSFDGFEMVIRAILGQQISVAGARTLAGRFAEQFGSRVDVAVPALGYLFPRPDRIARVSVVEIARLGIIGRRAETIIALAKAISGGDLILEPGNRLEGTLKRLRQIPGIGEWTSQYIAMRALSWPDAFPHSDLGVMKALGEKNSKKIIEMTEKWRPWRAYAVPFMGQPGEKIMKTTTFYSTFKTPLGDLLLVANPTELIGLYFEDCAHAPADRKGWVFNSNHPVLKKAEKQLLEYFEGRRTEFSLPLHVEGTEFQKRVWQAIASIPFGQTITYSKLASQAGNPNAIRAAGTNTGRNPLGIIIPCHRVMAKGGGIGGFAGGLAWKRHLLALESEKGVLLAD